MKLNFTTSSFFSLLMLFFCFSASNAQTVNDDVIRGPWLMPNELSDELELPTNPDYPNILSFGLYDQAKEGYLNKAIFSGSNTDGSAFEYIGDYTLKNKTLAIDFQDYDRTFTWKVVDFVGYDETSQTLVIQTDKGMEYSLPRPDFGCFPAGSIVSMADGTEKAIENILIGEKVIAFEDGKKVIAEVYQVDIHDKTDYDLTNIQVSSPNDSYASLQNHVSKSISLLATPNHPIMTNNGFVKAGLLKTKDVVYHYNTDTNQFDMYEADRLENKFQKSNKVYNLRTDKGNYLVNGIVVSNK